MASGVDWRSKLDTQKGAVLATELQNNSCKLAKWTLQALLAGSDQIKFGLVSAFRYGISEITSIDPRKFNYKVAKSLTSEGEVGLTRL